MPDIILAGHLHTCPSCGPTKVSSDTKSFTIDNRSVACVGDSLECGAVIVSGSSLMLVAGVAVARVGDSTDHGGTLENGDNCWVVD